MKQTHSLTQIKEIIAQYGPMGEQWLCTHPRKISVRAQLLLSTLRNLNDSMLRQTDIKRTEIQSLSRKLMHLYPEFQEWVLNRFILCLANITARQGMRTFIHLPIYSLEIPDAAKEQIEKLGISTLVEIGERYTNKQLKERRVFNTVLEFLDEAEKDLKDRPDVPLFQMYQDQYAPHHA